MDASIGEMPAERNLTRELEGSDVTTTTHPVSEGRFPPSARGDAWRDSGVVTSGSQTSVDDDESWIHELTAWARGAHRADVPMLGVRWGHQFLARAPGGCVVDTGEYEPGYHTAERAGDDPLFPDVPASLTAFQTHSDRVAEPPSGAVELAHSDRGLQAFRLGSTYGVQFHPGCDRETAEWVIGTKDLATGRLQSVRRTITDESVAAAREAARVFENYRRIVAEHGRHPQRTA